jgi:hypothetical protein
MEQRRVVGAADLLGGGAAGGVGGGKIAGVVAEAEAAR